MGNGQLACIHDGVVIVQADVQKESFLAAFDAGTGRELWRSPRNDVPTWSTPTVHPVNGQTEIVVNGMRHAGAYDFKTGKEIWRLSGGGDIPVPTPVVHDGLVYLTNAHGPAAPVYAIRANATGDVSLADGATRNDGVAWSQPRDGGYMCTPLVYRGLVYIVKFNGVSRVRRDHRRAQVPGAAGGGICSVHRFARGQRWQGLSGERGRPGLRDQSGADVELIAMNEMGAPVLATPAISEGRLYFRTSNELVAIRVHLA